MPEIDEDRREGLVLCSSSNVGALSTCGRYCLHMGSIVFDPCNPADALYNSTRSLVMILVSSQNGLVMTARAMLEQFDAGGGA
ncbi:hypothetical protein FHS20_000436 [Phyllobacterium endophyticum]|nr:hypothetical protein [Phyllobacterium endophyticum]